MGQITVTPGVLESAGGAIQQVGNEFYQLSGQIDTLRSGVGAAQPETARALQGFVQNCTRSMVAFAESVDQFGAATSKAGTAYRETDQAAIPVGAAGASAGGADGGGEA